MEAFWLSLSLIFLAELGDKTQLVALLLATRYTAGVVLAGIFVATLAVHALSVALGGATGHLLPQGWIYFFSGLAFIGFGWWTLRGDSLEEQDYRPSRFKSPFIIVFVTFFLAELGDKTMLGTVTLAAGRELLPVWLGSTLGMVLSDALAIVVGRILGKQLPERPVKIGAALIFVAFGLFYVFTGALALWGSYN
ncbi:MAG: TMEM165/GDT1 family protein [Deltaproteobacteria bacterium]|nr:TMEM165/GDT1 family protein [Deltaproteobacteria bacterium]